MSPSIYFAIVILFLLIYRYRNYLRIQLFTSLVVLRGTISASKFFWGVSELLLGSDLNGIQLYRQLDQSHPTYLTRMFGTPLYIVFDQDYQKVILDESPQTFGVGSLKQSFFKTFMPKNVGISEDDAWIRRRELNEEVLATGCPHPFINNFHTRIKKALLSRRQAGKTLNNFNDFSEIALDITFKIVFNDDKPIPEVVRIFDQANDIKSFYHRLDIKSVKEYQIYRKYLLKSMDSPQPGSLVDLAMKLNRNLSKKEIYDQIPHWIFPINGTFTHHILRILLYIAQTERVSEKIIEEIMSLNNPDNAAEIFHMEYLRAVVLEAFRINNVVSTTFRTLRKDNFQFPNQKDKCDYTQYKKGDEFVILNNPILRSPECFQDPDYFMPERWLPVTDKKVCGGYSNKLENNICALMFNQGPQECPGKDIILFLLQSFIVNYYLIYGFPKKSEPKLSPDKMPQNLNPFKIHFF